MIKTYKYKLYGKHLNKFKLQKHLTKLKKRKSYSFWKNVPSQSIQDITDRIDKGYKKFFDYKKGKISIKTSIPNYKKIQKYKSYTLKGKVGYKLNNNIISLNGYDYKFFLSRKIEGTIKTVIIKRDNIGNFFICISLEIEKTKKHVATGKSVGIDFGLSKFLTLSDKQVIKSPLYHLTNLSKIKILNRNLSKKQKDSNNRKKAKIDLAKLHIKIENQRKDYFHKLSNQLVNNYDYIFIEDLNLNAMKKLWGRKVSDLAFAEFIKILEYKMNYNNKTLIKIDRFYPSSKTCSNCGTENKKNNKKLKDLKERGFKCEHCGFKIDRDINAAINIKRVGASILVGEVVRAS